jgi:Uma2 family endonuclease
MGSAPRADYFVSVEDYLDGERIADQKHEYLAGAIHAMAGTTIDHDRIAVNIVIALSTQLRGRPCEVFSSDIKVRIQRDAATFFYYPDVTVDCSGPRDGSAVYLEEPRVIFEVLSPGTERVGRGEKRLNYQALPSLETYVLVDQTRLAVSVYRRTPEGWTFDLLTEPADVLELPEVECRLPLAGIYERTSLLA